jgi:hypothetical protein
VANHAWPYAVSRDERSGYQAVMVPEFLADAGQTYVLEYASKGQAGRPDTMTVREVRGAVTEPLSLAYRVAEVRADGGETHGRTIRVFEGLVLQMPAEQVASLGLTVADLDGVATITAPALRKLWTAETRIDAAPSAAIAVGHTADDARLLDLKIANPWVVPGDRPNQPAETRSGRNGLIIAAVIVCVMAALLVWYLTGLLPHTPPVSP